MSGDATDLLEPGQAIRPNVSLDLAKELVQKYYGYQVDRVKELNSYDDNNFLIEAKNTSGVPGKYILKVLNSQDSKKTGHVQAENAGMTFLNKNGIFCPVPQTNLEGNTFEVVDIPLGGESSATSRNCIRLLTFVEGKLFCDVKQTPELLFKAGAYIAQVDNIFKNFHHPVLDTHSSNWLMINSLELRKFMYVIKEDTGRYDMVKSIMDAFEEKVIPSYPVLPKGVIHGDYNEQNIIVRPCGSGEDHEIHGIIDFGDLQSSYYVFELAIVLCYLMLECVRVGDLDPFVGGARILAGYNKFRKVTQKELELLKILICSRLCQSLVMGAYTYSLNPGNEYLLFTAKTGWNLMNLIWNETSDEQLLKVWSDAINS